MPRYFKGTAPVVIAFIVRLGIIFSAEAAKTSVQATPVPNLERDQGPPTQGAQETGDALGFTEAFRTEDLTAAPNLDGRFDIRIILVGGLKADGTLSSVRVGYHSVLHELIHRLERLEG